MMKNQVSLHIAIFWVLVAVSSSCTSMKKVFVSRDIQRSLKNSEIFRNQFTGFVLYDPEKKEFIAKHNSNLYFTPASNTKILTTLSSIEAFGDSIPTFLYAERNDSIYLEPLGDPSFLHVDFPEQPTFQKLMDKNVLIHFPDEELTAFGPGWAWDDYEYNFQTERSWFPVYGNEVRIINEQKLHVIPDFFEDYVDINIGAKQGSRVYRERKFNLFNIWMEQENSPFERKIPFDYSKELVLRLLSDTLNNRVAEINHLPDLSYDTLYNQSFLPVLALMMQRSDNFLAEQLLVLAARKSGFTNVNAFRKQKIAEWSSFLPAPIQWVDGSGLSRYNLVTPETLVSVLNEIYQKLEWWKIATIFPTGGESGTIKYWYYGNPPYIYAKTGTLSNNHSLSGYIRTRSGKTLIFSLMNNHYTRPVAEVKTEMEKFLESIRDAL